MDDPNDPITPARMRTMRIIVFAQTMGLVIFAAAVFFIVQNRRVPPKDNGILSMLGLAMLAGLGTASVAFPQSIRRQNVRRIARGEWQPPPGTASAYALDSAKLFAVYLSTLIMGLALVEGAGMYCCIAIWWKASPTSWPSSPSPSSCRSPASQRRAVFARGWTCSSIGWSKSAAGLGRLNRLAAAPKRPRICSRSCSLCHKGVISPLPGAFQ